MAITESQRLKLAHDAEDFANHATKQFEQEISVRTRLRQKHPDFSPRSDIEGAIETMRQIAQDKIRTISHGALNNLINHGLGIQRGQIPSSAVMLFVANNYEVLKQLAMDRAETEYTERHPEANNAARSKTRHLALTELAGEESTRYRQFTSKRRGGRA